MKYFSFELKRIFSSKKNKVLFSILTILLIVLVGFSINLKNSNNIKVMENFLNDNITVSTQALEGMRNDSSVPKDIVKDSEDLLKLYNSQKNALQNNDVKKYYKLQLEVNNMNIQHGQAGEFLEDENKYIKDVLKKGLDFENYPQAQLHSFGVIHEVFFPLIFSSLFYIILLIMGGISIASNFENESMRLYKTPLFHKKNIILANFGANVFSLTIWYLSAVAFYIVSVGIMNGFGALNYPSAIQDLYIVDNWKIDLVYLVWGFLLIFFIVSLGTLLSLVVRKSILVVGLFAIIVLGFDMIKNQIFMEKFLKYIPMSYFEPIKLLQNNNNLPDHALIVGAIYLLSLTIIFLLISMYKYRKISFRKI